MLTVSPSLLRRPSHWPFLSASVQPGILHACCNLSVLGDLALPGERHLLACSQLALHELGKHHQLHHFWSPAQALSLLWSFSLPS